MTTWAVVISLYTLIVSTYVVLWKDPAIDFRDDRQAPNHDSALVVFTFLPQLLSNVMDDSTSEPPLASLRLTHVYYVRSPPTDYRPPN
jgi:hypothetical protein